MQVWKEESSFAKTKKHLSVNDNSLSPPHTLPELTRHHEHHHYLHPGHEHSNCSPLSLRYHTEHRGSPVYELCSVPSTSSAGAEHSNCAAGRPECVCTAAGERPLALSACHETRHFTGQESVSKMSDHYKRGFLPISASLFCCTKGIVTCWASQQ